MGSSEAGELHRKYDRDFLLSAGKRNQLMALWEVEKYGRDCFSDPRPRSSLRYGASRLVRAGRSHSGAYLPRGCEGPTRQYDWARHCRRRHPRFRQTTHRGNRSIRQAPATVSIRSCGTCRFLKGIRMLNQFTVFDLTTRNIAHLKAPIELVEGSYKNLVGSKKHPSRPSCRCLSRSSVGRRTAAGNRTASRQNQTAYSGDRSRFRAGVWVSARALRHGSTRGERTCRSQGRRGGV